MYVILFLCIRLTYYWHCAAGIYGISDLSVPSFSHAPPPAWGRILVYVHVMYQGVPTQQPAFFWLCSASVVEWGGARKNDFYKLFTNMPCPLIQAPLTPPPHRKRGETGPPPNGGIWSTPLFA